MDDQANETIATGDPGERPPASPHQRRLARAAVIAGIAGLRPVVTQSSEGLTLVVLGRRDGGVETTAGDPSAAVAVPAGAEAVRSGSRADARTEPDAFAAVVGAFMLPPGAVGVAVGVFDRIVSLEAYDEPAALRTVWPDLVAEAVVAWLERRRSIEIGEAPLPGRRIPDEGATARLLRRASVALADADVRSDEGGSVDVRIAGERVEGWAQVMDGRAIRLALARPERPDPPDGLVP